MGKCSLQNLLQLTLIISVVKKFEQSCLETKNSTKCCADFYFQDGICKPCKPGWIGPNCIATCPYPTYGHKCINVCKCTKNECDVSEGCIKSTYANFIGTTDKGLLVHVPTLVYKTQPTTEMDDTSDKQNDDNSINDKSLYTSHLLFIVILSSASSLVISVVVIVIVVCRRSSQSKRRDGNVRKRRSTASHGRPSTSYHEIDERFLSPDILFQRQSNGGEYINLDQTKIEKSKYTTLPQVQN